MVSAEADRTATAFACLVATLEDALPQMERLIERSATMRTQVSSGAALAEAATREQRPLIITTMTELLDRLSDATAEVRRAEAHQLRSEGLSHERIAALFGVTRQRVAALLAPPPTPEARAAKRPHRR
jgi:DNA-directed RNA polymerase sigma subunit (sigma70/sigma32)